jgi:hypothetical protein
MENRMSDQRKSASPTKQLSQRTIERLAGKSLILSVDIEAAQAKYSEGKMNSSDWKLLFEKSLSAAKRIVKDPAC